MIAAFLGVLDPQDEVVVFEPFYENKGTCTLQDQSRSLSSSSSTISMSSTFSVRLKIVAAKSLKGVWRASKLEGTIEQRSSAQLGCVSSGTDESFTATLYPA
jgi:hypothetical protein